MIRYTRADVKCVHRELNKLEDMGIMRSRTAGKYRLYILNRDHPVHGELRSIFARTKREWEHYTRWPYVRMWEKQEGNKENRPG